MRILILEDNNDDYDDLEKSLRRLINARGVSNVECVRATNPADALQAALSGEFYLAFADVNMNPRNPHDRGGIEGFIRPLAGKISTPIICMSSDERNEQYGLQAGAVDFLDKQGLCYSLDPLERILDKYIPKQA